MCNRSLEELVREEEQKRDQQIAMGGAFNEEQRKGLAMQTKLDMYKAEIKML